MKTTLLTATLALVLISISSISSFAKDDDEDAYRSSHRDGYRSHYRGDYDERSEDRQENENMDRGRDRWRDTGSMARMRSGARFQFSRGDAHIDIRCPQNESLQNCVLAASQLIDKVQSLTPGPPAGREVPTPSPGSR
jgi:uncharacterized heparinase superfamily protein